MSDSQIIDYYHPYWVEMRWQGNLSIRPSLIQGCFMARNEQEAKELASKWLHENISVHETDDIKFDAWILPYTADPVLAPHPDPKRRYPSFCWRPQECKGRTACPRNPSCTE